jgi:hypothetical protein
MKTIITFIFVAVVVATASITVQRVQRVRIPAPVVCKRFY